MEPIDLKKKYKELYKAKETPSQVVAPECACLAIDGVGRPGGEAYQEAIQKLYGVAYTMKFALKGAGILDFKIPNMDCLWLTNPDGNPLVGAAIQFAAAQGTIPSPVSTNADGEAQTTLISPATLESDQILR